MSKTYSVVKVYGGAQDVLSEGLPLREANDVAMNASDTDIVAVVDDDTDTLVDAWYQAAKMDRGQIRTIVFGLGRFV